MSVVVEPEWGAITDKLRALVPEATAIIFFGSRVRGLPAPTSDYDVLVLTPTGVELDERERVKETLQRTFPDIRFDLAFGSERWVRANLSREAHLRFWLENGIATYGNIPRIKRYPPLYKDVIGTNLDLIKARFLLARGWSRTQYFEAQQYLSIFKQLLLIELALRNEYRNEMLWGAIQDQVGLDLLEILRDATQRRRIRKPMVRRMERLVSRKISKLRRELQTSNLPSLLSSN